MDGDTATATKVETTSASATGPAAGTAPRRRPWPWIGALIGLAVAAALSYAIHVGLGDAGVRLADGERGFSFAAPAGFAAAEAIDGGAWAFSRANGADHATLTVKTRRLPSGMSVRGYALQHGGAMRLREVAGTHAWQTSTLALGMYERLVFVPLPDGRRVVEIRLVTGPIEDWQRASLSNATAARADDLAALDALLASLTLDK